MQAVLAEKDGLAALEAVDDHVLDRGADALALPVHEEVVVPGSLALIGHVHRLAKFMKTSDGKTMTWTESGCLCKLEAEYMTRPPNWQHGAVLLFRYSDGSVIHELVRIVDGRVQGTLGMLVHG